MRLVPYVLLVAAVTALAALSILLGPLPHTMRPSYVLSFNTTNTTATTTLPASSTIETTTSSYSTTSTSSSVSTTTSSIVTTTSSTVSSSSTTMPQASLPGPAGAQPYGLTILYEKFGRYLYTTNATTQQQYNTTNSTAGQPGPTYLQYQQFSNMSEMTQSQAAALFSAFGSYMGGNAIAGVTEFNLTANVPYGSIMNRSTGMPIDANTTGYFAAYNTHHTLTLYSVRVMRAKPSLSLDIDGAVIRDAGVYPVHVPVLPGQTSWNLNVSATSSLLPGNSGKYTFLVRLSNGTLLVPNTTINGSGFTQELNYRLPASVSANVTLDFSGSANYTPLDPSGPTIPTGILRYWNVTVDNLQSSATGNYFQLMVPFNALANSINVYVGNTLSNTEWFYANGTIIPSWMEGNALSPTQANDLNSTANGIYWVKLNPSVAATSNAYIYYGASTFGTNLLSNTVDGFAPQLFCASGCPQTSYGQYDDGTDVFNYYNANPTTTSGWTIAGTAGQTSAAPSGSYFQAANALYANSANGDYMYRQVNGLSENQVITFWVYTTGLGNLFFLTSSTGAGQMGRLDGRGGADYSGLAATASWTSWSAPSSGLSETTGTWYKYDVVVAGSTATSYIGSSENMLESLGTLANTHAVADNGNYIGLVGDALGSSHITYWNGFVAREYPPSGVQPTVSFSNPVAVNAPVVLTITPNPVTYGSTSSITATCAPSTDTCEILVNSVLEATGTGSASYTFPVSPVGPYTVNGFNVNLAYNVMETLSVIKATPLITLPNFPSNFTYSGSPVTITANIVTVNSQLTANDYINGAFHASFTTQDQFTETLAGTYGITANTPGDANYIAASVSKTFFICPAASSFPANIVDYACIRLGNAQSANTASPFQQMLSVNSLAYNGYESNSLDNIEFFYANGTVIPSWLEGSASNSLLDNSANSINLHSSTNTTYWLSVNSIPATSNETVYMGFASGATNLLNGVNDGEFPALSATYAQYDDGTDVFNYYNANPTTSSGWTIAGTAGQTSAAPSGSYFQAANALYANSASGDYMYTSNSGITTNEILTYWTYTNALGDAYFLDSSAGAGQMSRLGCGGGWYGVAATTSWTAWTAPPDTGPTCNIWYKVDVVMTGTTAQDYYTSSDTQLGVYGSNAANLYTITVNGNYIGLVGDGAGATDITYWNGFVARAYPPNGVMPEASFTNVSAVPSGCTIALSPSSISFGTMDPGSSFPTNAAVTDTNGGTLNSYVYVYGGNWISGAVSFGGSNTLWDASSQSSYTGTALTGTASNTAILVPPSSGSNSVYFGVGIPNGQQALTYDQVITIENVC